NRRSAGDNRAFVRSQGHQSSSVGSRGLPRTRQTCFQVGGQLLSRRRKLPTDRFERDSPVIERFEKLTGISMQELDAELPVPTDETASSNARQPDRPAAPAVPAAKPRHSRT